MRRAGFHSSDGPGQGPQSERLFLREEQLLRRLSGLVVRKAALLPLKSLSVFMAPTKSSLFLLFNVDPPPPSCPRQCNLGLHSVLPHLRPQQSPAGSKLGVSGRSQTQPVSPNPQIPKSDTARWESVPVHCLFPQ